MGSAPAPSREEPSRPFPPGPFLLPPCIPSYGSRTSLRNPLPAFRQPHPSPPRLERAGREHKPLSHIPALAQPHPLPRVPLPPELLFCFSLASRCAPLPRKGLFPLAQGLPGSGLGAAWHSAVLGPAVIPSAHVCTRAALQELSGTQKMSSQLPPSPHGFPSPSTKVPPATASSTAAPGADERGTLCGAANSSELNQRRGRIAKPPEMKPKKSLLLFSANREPRAEATSRTGAQ